MTAAQPPPGFTRAGGEGWLAVVRADLAQGARALGLLAPDGIARAFAIGARMAGGRAPAAAVAWPAGGPEVILRRFRHGGALGPLLGAAYLGTGRALRELALTADLAARAPGLVPQPALALARRLAGPFWECALGTRRVSGADLLAALQAARDAAARERALRASARAVRAFHDLGARHADLNAGNLLLAPRGDGLAATVIDLDRARLGEPVPARRRAREIARLWRSLDKRGGAARLAAAERDAFLAAYCARDAALERALRAALRRERWRTALHALRYARR